MAVGLGGFAVERARAQETIPTFVVKWADIRSYTDENPFPNGVAAGDAVGEGGFPDLVVGSSYVNFFGADGDELQPGKITILQNTGNWSGPTSGLQLYQDILLDPTALVSDVAFADVDNDGDLDVVAAAGRTIEDASEQPGLYVSELVEGVYSDPPDYYSTSPGGVLFGFRGMAVADLNNDGYVDVACAVDGDELFGNVDRVYVFRNKGAADPGKFELIIPIVEYNFVNSDEDPVPYSPHEIVAADFFRLTTGQSRVDLVTALRDDFDAVAFMRNQGNNGNAEPQFLNSRLTPCNARMGFHDIVSGRFKAGSQHEDVAGWRPYEVSILRGNSRGQFAHDCSFPSPDYYQLSATGCTPCGENSPSIITGGLATGHINGGTKPDIVAAACHDRLGLLLGTAGGAMQFDCSNSAYFPSFDPIETPLDLTGAGNMIRVIIADMNQDGFGDIVTVNQEAWSSAASKPYPYVSILINQLNVGGGE